MIDLLDDVVFVRLERAEQIVLAARAEVGDLEAELARVQAAANAAELELERAQAAAREQADARRRIDALITQLDHESRAAADAILAEAVAEVDFLLGRPAAPTPAAPPAPVHQTTEPPAAPPAADLVAVPAVAPTATVVTVAPAFARTFGLLQVVLWSIAIAVVLVLALAWFA